MTFHHVDEVRPGLLPLDALHTMYFEESGDPQGRPVVYLHGGAGAGTEPNLRQQHDPKVCLAPDQLLDGIPAIRHIPGFIVNGRLDVVCPPVTAVELKRVWPEAELELVPQAGHFSTEPGIAAALLRIMESLE